MSESLPYIVTNKLAWKNLQQRNKLKGMAQRRIISFTFSKIGEKIHKNESTIKKIINAIKGRIGDFLLIKKSFKICETEFSSKGTKWITKKDIPEQSEVYFKEKVKEKYTGEKKEEEKTGWHVCSFCGLRIPTSKKWSRKCMHCRRGYFRMEKKTVKKQVERERKVEKWIKKFEGNKKEVIEFLIKEGFLKKPERCVNRNRLDSWRILDNEIIIYESKNKEKTKVYFNDIYQTLKYVKIVLKSGLPFRKATILYNGELSKEIENFVRDLRKMGTNIWLKSAKEWLKYFYRRTGTAVKEIKITRSKKYDFDFVLDKKFPEKVIIRK